MNISPAFRVIVALFMAVTLAGCTNRDMPNTSMAWKITPASDNTVDVALVMSGALVQEVPLGTFDGGAIEDQDLLYREWWSGSKEVLSVRRKDSAHLVIMRTPLDGEVVGQELTTITIPTGLRVECVDTGGCV